MRNDSRGMYVYLVLIWLEELRAEERTELARLDPGVGGGGRPACEGTQQYSDAYTCACIL